MAALEPATAEAAWFGQLPLRSLRPLTPEDAPYFFDWLDHPDYDDFWRATAIDEDYSRIGVPGLHVAGWYDIFLSGTVTNFAGLRSGAATEAARAGQKLVVGPWQPRPLGAAARRRRRRVARSSSTNGSCAFSTRSSRDSRAASSTPPSARTSWARAGATSTAGRPPDRVPWTGTCIPGAGRTRCTATGCCRRKCRVRSRPTRSSMTR